MQSVPAFVYKVTHRKEDASAMRRPAVPGSSTTMIAQPGKRTAIFVLCISLIFQLEAAPLDNDCLKTAVRVKRMTPFWRIMSMRPVGASCRDDTECLTRLCRNQRCCLKTYAD